MNPVAIGAIAVVAALGWFLSRPTPSAKKKPPKNDESPPDVKPAPAPSPTPPKPKPDDEVLPDMFPDIAKKGMYLAQIGYPSQDAGTPKWDGKSTSAKAAIKKFQQDFNLLISVGFINGYSKLGVDSKIGPKTTYALAYAVSGRPNLGKISWLNWVMEAKKNQSTKDSSAEPLVGYGWTSWPRQDLFGNVPAFGYVLGQLGYPSAGAGQGNWDPLEQSAVNAIKEFQQDYNAVVDFEYYPTQKNKITASGKIGSRTVNALAFAFKDRPNITSEPWNAVVMASKEG